MKVRLLAKVLIRLRKVINLEERAGVGSSRVKFVTDKTPFVSWRWLTYVSLDNFVCFTAVSCLLSMAFVSPLQQTTKSSKCNLKYCVILGNFGICPYYKMFENNFVLFFSLNIFIFFL